MAKATKHTGLSDAAPAGYDIVGTHHGIHDYVLKKNGLRVLYRHDPTTPVVGVMVTYLVGSRHEAVGYTGATHLLEHLMFKGSKQFPPIRGTSALDRLGEKGALVNATTWLDRTNYYEVLPDEHAEFAIQLEADRMRNAILTEKDRAEEMPAVRSEFAMGENEALEILDKHIWATAFMAHPYHHPTIGWQEDFEQVSIERLKQFYDTYYWPNNAVVSVIGNIEERRALTLVKRHFGVHSRSPHPIPMPYTKEPRQTGKRFVSMSRAGTKNMLGVAYKVPEALHKDTAALLTLSSILADGTTSRLHRALIEKRLCSDVRPMYSPFYAPSLLPIYCTLTNGVTHQAVERTLLREIDHIAQNGVSQAELDRVLASLLTELALARDGHYAMLSALNEAIAVGDWRFFFDLPRQVKRVTTEDIVRVARTYCVLDQATIGHYNARTV